MVYEFALEPELVARWYDRKEYLFFDEKFGVRPRRIVSTYPKTWKKLVWEAFRRGPSSDDQNAQMRITELIQQLWQNSVRRHSSFSEVVDWLERAEKEHVERPFHAIVATTNPRNQSFVITADGLIENGHERWNVPDIAPTPRVSEEIARVLLPALRLSRHVILVDPYFDPNKPRFGQTLKAIFIACEENVCGFDKIEIELHTSIDRFFNGLERGERRDPGEEKRVYEKLETDFRKTLTSLMGPRIELKVVIWKQKRNGEKLHNRYLLTNMLGIMLGTGSDAAANPDSLETDDIVLLDEKQYAARYEQYLGSCPAFDLVGQPILFKSRQ
jgi:hypothetical protein